MVILAGLVLFFVGFPLLAWMLEGAIVLAELIVWMIRSLWCLYRAVSRPKPAKKRPGTKRTTTTRKPVDPVIQKNRAMEATWRAQGYRVGVINHDTGEVYEASSD